MPYNPGSNFTETSGYGLRVRNGRRDNHTAIDYAAERGTDIPAAAEGEVWYYGRNNRGYGNTVILRHAREDGSYYYTLYAHMDTVPDYLRLGQQVSAGDIIGQAGDSGGDEGKYHLHFELITPPDGMAPRRTDEGGETWLPQDTYRSDPDSFDGWPESGVYDGSQSTVEPGDFGRRSEEEEVQKELQPHKKIPGFIPDRTEYEIRKRVRERRKKRSSGSSPCRETLERHGKWGDRIEPDCSRRGSFYSP